ncbi:hypothetical protein OSC52_06930 [Clostridium pasteurianum]|uniref:hypothetical protein n=1 Tax=Clostridium pasteurianum TaxID=1501 RepID=UPI002260C53A|nr:hypothetical protein [Clostridium pasteurianum]UZW15566.1 hypothetical protein OSC52_06930 [Clostridium pasteurianum]
MGALGDMQFLIPIGFIAILFKFAIVDFNRYRWFKYFVVSIILYTIIKIIILNKLEYNSDFTGMSIVMIILIMIFSYIIIYKGIVKTIDKNIKDTAFIEKVQAGYFVGIVFFIFPIFVRVANLSFLYRGEIKNFYLLLFEYFLSGFIILFFSTRGAKLIKNIK